MTILLDQIMNFDYNINIVPQVVEIVKDFVIPNLKDFVEVYNTYICQNVTNGKVHFTNIILDHQDDIANVSLDEGFDPKRYVFYVHWEWNQDQSKTDERTSSNSKVSVPNPKIIIYIVYTPRFYSDLENTSGILPDNFKLYGAQVIITTSDGQQYFWREFSFEEEDIIVQSIKSFYYEAIALLESHKQGIIRSLNKELI